MKDKLIAAGVKNLQEFGYPKCTKDNIMTDLVYRRFFVSMLKENKGHGAEVDKAINELLAECAKNEAAVDKKDIRKKAK